MSHDGDDVIIINNEEEGDDPGGGGSCNNVAASTVTSGCSEEEDADNGQGNMMCSGRFFFASFGSFEFLLICGWSYKRCEATTIGFLSRVF